MTFRPYLRVCSLWPGLIRDLASTEESGVHAPVWWVFFFSLSDGVGSVGVSSFPGCVGVPWVGWVWRQRVVFNV